MDKAKNKNRYSINWDEDYSPRNIASTTDCTGMMYKPPVTEDEAEGYEDIYPVPQQTDVNAQQTGTARRQEQISSVRKGRK